MIEIEALKPRILASLTGSKCKFYSPALLRVTRRLSFFALRIIGLVVLTIGPFVLGLHWRAAELDILSVELKVVSGRLADLEGHIITPAELQEKLAARGYDLGPCGIDGRPGPATLAAWHLAVCDQAATVYFEGDRSQ